VNKNPLTTLRFREADRQKMLDAFHDREKLHALSIPPYIFKDGAYQLNPEWENAPYEEILLDKDGKEIAFEDLWKYAPKQQP
jgi:hypothetical protein